MSAIQYGGKKRRWENGKDSNWMGMMGRTVTDHRWHRHPGSMTGAYVWSQTSLSVILALLSPLLCDLTTVLIPTLLRVWLVYWKMGILTIRILGTQYKSSILEFWTDCKNYGTWNISLTTDKDIWRYGLRLNDQLALLRILCLKKKKEKRKNLVLNQWK